MSTCFSCIILNTKQGVGMWGHSSRSFDARQTKTRFKNVEINIILVHKIVLQATWQLLEVIYSLFTYSVSRRESTGRLT